MAVSKQMYLQLSRQSLIGLLAASLIICPLAKRDFYNAD
jgi:hypothetical protein